MYSYLFSAVRITNSKFIVTAEPHSARLGKSFAFYFGGAEKEDEEKKL
jgi:hypothetical protein